MGDQLEKFIINHRDGFDNIEPSDELWSKIDHKLERKSFNMAVVWKVAAVLFLVSTIVLLVDRSGQEGHQGPLLSQEFVEAEDYYVMMINERKQLIAEQLSPEQEEIFLTEINELDAMYIELKKTYQTNASSERVVDAMINNLQLRLEILNRQLEILKQMKGQNQETNITI